MSTMTARLASERTPRALLMVVPAAADQRPEAEDRSTVICDSCKYLTVAREVFC
jgi:hypothetical protein